ncbi:PH domain-containing protein [Pseudoalteromonas prydzensis]|uniref:PH domain-containing protein n=1 Tax=Pseudoalteromonas prydzensis TaxID=182141 RepID=UPI0007E4E142|nr:PH domain-containing protein [Pseudoalteromonas prydzensis]MBE0377243.1 putative membrane protein [Pseudoalteromonas prydzensis ACAM 620]
MDKLNWQRVSPWALVYFIVHFAFRFVKDGVFNLLPIMVVFVTQVENKLFWGQIAVAVAAVALLIYSLAYYLNFRFCITDEHEILLNKGVFKKERLTLNFLRVQNVNIAEPFYFKPLSLVNCIFDAAGSTSQEAVLPGVTTQYAEQLREQVLAYKATQQQQVHTNQQIDDLTTTEPQQCLTLSNKEVAKFGLMSNMAILALAALAPFMNVMFDFLEKAVINRLESFYQQQVGILVDAAALAVFSILLLVVLIAVLLSVLMSLIRFYNYQLYFQAGKFKRIAGLLERHQLSVSLDKVQSITIKQNLIARLLKRYTVQCFQASSGGFAGAKSKQSLVMPVLDSEQVNQVCQWVYPWLDLKTLNFMGVEKALLIKNWLFYALLPSLALAVLCVVGDMLTLVYALLSLLLLSGLVYLSYRRYGYYFYQHEGRFYGVFRSGMVSVQYRVFELYKAQSTRSISTYFMRKGGLKSLSIQLASGTVYLPYLKAAQADEVIDFTLYQAEFDQRSWM